MSFSFVLLETGYHEIRKWGGFFSYEEKGFLIDSRAQGGGGAVVTLILSSHCVTRNACLTLLVWSARAIIQHLLKESRGRERLKIY